MANFQVKDIFKTWKEFESRLTEWRDANHQPLFIHNSAKPIRKYNESLPNLEPLDEELKYFSVKILCVHSENRKSNAKQVKYIIYVVSQWGSLKQNLITKKTT